LLGFLIGQSLGRWGNFFNREAFGAETDSFLRMGLTGVGLTLGIGFDGGHRCGLGRTGKGGKHKCKGTDNA
ncbi:MAG: prolipoprotein diacylglyceryl transferase, partial [Alistipes sp.]|nr:prolipoprotein diacylglyceryl transferase [Alistipes sp.]